MRLEALRQEHPGKNDEPWLFVSFAGISPGMSPGMLGCFFPWMFFL